MHHIPNIQVEDPVVLVFHPQNSLHIVLQFDVSTLALRYGMGVVHLSPRVVVG